MRKRLDGKDPPPAPQAATCAPPPRSLRCELPKGIALRDAVVKRQFDALPYPLKRDNIAAFKVPDVGGARVVDEAERVACEWVDPTISRKAHSIRVLNRFVKIAVSPMHDAALDLEDEIADGIAL